MNKYVAIAFAFLGLWFYEASGGADFVPGDTSLVVFAKPKPVPAEAEPRAEVVARAISTAPLTDVVPARGTEPADATTGLTLVSLDTPVSEPESVPEPVLQVVEAEPAPVVQEPLPDLRFVDGDRVNMRSGPGTDYAVVAQLLRDDMVEVITDNGDGWLQLKDTISGQEGWIADWLVTASN